MDDKEVIDLDPARSPVGTIMLSDSVPNGPCYFWNLPLEIRDMIYVLCYGDDRKVKFKVKEYWRYEEKRSRRFDRDFVAKPFEENGILCDKLVCKQFLEEAARVWIRTKTFFIYKSFELETIWNFSSELERFFLRSITSLEIRNSSTWTSDPWQNYPAAVNLSITIRPKDVLGDSDEKVVWLDDLTDADLVGSCAVKQYVPVRGLQSLTIIRGTDSRITKAEHVARWKSVYARVEKMLFDMMTAPRETPRIASRVPTFDEALALTMTSERAPAPSPESSLSTESAKVVALTDDEIPDSETDVIRTFLTRPQAMLAWIAAVKASRKGGTSDRD